MEDLNDVQQEEEEWQVPDEWWRILQMVFCSGYLEINPVGCGFISSYVLNTKGTDVAHVWIQYKRFICGEDKTSDHNFEAR